MKKTNQKIAIAKALGWTDIEFCPFQEALIGCSPDDIYEEVPDWLNDLNAMHEVEKTLKEDQIWDFISNLNNHYISYKLVFATAAQRAEAFLRTLGLWEESTEDCGDDLTYVEEGIVCGGGLPQPKDQMPTDNELKHQYAQSSWGKLLIELGINPFEAESSTRRVAEHAACRIDTLKHLLLEISSGNIVESIHPESKPNTMNKYPIFSKPTDAEQLSEKGLDATICSSLARYLSEKQDAAIRQAINNHLGREDWSIEEVIPRLALCSYEGSELQTITMDGEPIMSIGPVKMNPEERGRSTFLRATRGYKILNETNVQAQATQEGANSPTKY